MLPESQVRPACSCLPPTVAVERRFHGFASRAGLCPSFWTCAGWHLPLPRSFDSARPISVRAVPPKVCLHFKDIFANGMFFAICLPPFKRWTYIYARRHVRYGSERHCERSKKDKASAKGPVPLCRRLFHARAAAYAIFFGASATKAVTVIPYPPQTALPFPRGCCPAARSRRWRNATAGPLPLPKAPAEAECRRWPLRAARESLGALYKVVILQRFLRGADRPPLFQRSQHVQHAGAGINLSLFHGDLFAQLPVTGPSITGPQPET